MSTRALLAYADFRLLVWYYIPVFFVTSCLWNEVSYSRQYTTVCNISEISILVSKYWTNTHAHTVNTHSGQWAVNAAGPEEELGFRCLAQGSHLSRGIESGEIAGYSLSPLTIPAGPEIRTRNLL